MQIVTMLTYLGDLPLTAKEINDRLQQGWSLFSLNVDKATFTFFDDEDIERFAIRCARGNNGGEWATHYTEEQKQFWRLFVRDLAVEMLNQRGKIE